ncbi:MAG: GNAT family N-acetyltransferase [Erysipelotrichaceae bacterium]|nr:GNAT family N-acetyltransferase [Erysipelotrichaceae bacterium]
MDSRIIIANPSDADIVSEITQTTIRTVYPRYYPAGAVEFFSAHHSMDRIVSDIENGFVYILLVDGSPVGTVTISGNHINRLFVLPDHQRQGLGKALMDFAESKIFEDFDAIELDASLPAKKIYLKRGYVDEEYHIIEADGGDHLCYDVMRKTRENP